MGSDEDSAAASLAATVGDAERLLSAANDTSGVARNTWLAFLGVLAYLLVTLGGITHTDLLLNNPVRLPIINVDIPLSGFFVVAPLLLLILHFNLLVQHALVAHKYFQFARAVANSGFSEPPSHPLRFEVHSYVFSQLVAGPERPFAITLMMRLMVWLTISALPILTLLSFQVRFLADHDNSTTIFHQIAIVADLSMLLFLRVFYLFPNAIEEPSTIYSIAMKYIRNRQWGREQWDPILVSKTDDDPRPYWPWHPGMTSFIVSLSICSIVILFSILVVTVPDGAWDRRMSGLAPFVRTVADKIGNERRVFLLTGFLFERGTNSWLGRNLNISNADLVPDRGWEPNESSITLRNRDLEYAVLENSDFRRADFTEAELWGTSFTGSDLRGAVFSAAKLQNANLDDTDLQGARLRSARLQGASMFRARLQGADLSSADLRGADLRFADLAGADLRNANLQGANLGRANLQAAKLRGALVNCADLSNAAIWFTTPPIEDREQDCQITADLTDLKIIEPGPQYIDDLQIILADLKGKEGLLDDIQKALAPLLSPSEEQGNEWEEDRKWWAKSHPKPKDYDVGLSLALAEFACKDKNEEVYVSRGLFRRLSGFNFNGHVETLRRELEKGCKQPVSVPSLGELLIP